MKKGDRVLLNQESPFNDGDVENPINVKGTILGHHWRRPSFDRTAIATQILSGMIPQRQVAQIQSKKEEIVAAAIELTDELIKQLSA